MESLKLWLERKLDELIQFPATPDLISYIMEMENPLDIEHYFQSLLDVCNTKHRQFIQEYVQRRAKLVGVATGYKKKEVEEDYIAPMKSKNKKDNADASGNNVGTSSEQVSGKKKKQQAKAPKERRPCDCEASEHKLINNCLKCGRIVCSVEGSGPCLFCGELVCSREERRLIEQSDDGDTLYQKLMDRKVAKGLEEALKNRDRLVDFDRNCEQRTTVIDDAHDYFCDNSVWLTKEEREKIAAKQEKLDRQRHSRLGPRKITIDFAGREVREDNTPVDTYNPDVLDDIVNKTNNLTVGKSYASTMSPRVTIDVTASNIALESKILGRGTGAGQQGILSLKFPQDSLVGRVQDRGLMEMTDVGACLSIHQPWATLLVKGIKKEEGRTWYTPHRGKLWIASTSKQPLPEDLKLAKSVYGEDNFPTKFPAGCLLGCVLLVDCLPQEEYRERFPDGVDDSLYVFVCESPLELAIQFPMKGKPNIYKLDPKIHFAAQSNLSKSYALKAAAAAS